MKPLRRTVADDKRQPMDDDQLKWLVAESMWRQAADNGLEVVSFIESDPRDPDDIPPRVDRRIGATSDQFVWRVFEAEVRRA